MTAIRPLLFSFLLFLLPFNLEHPSLTDALNISYVVSTVVLPGEANSIESVPDHSQHTETTNSSPFLKDVLGKIAARKKWDLEKIRATKLEKPRYAYSKRYDYRIRTGQSDLIVRLSEKLEPWKGFDREVSDFEVAVNEVSSKAVLPTFALDGPLELLVRGDDWLSLLLPLNTSFPALKRILVGEGVRVDVTGAQGFLFIHNSCSNFSNESYVSRRKSGLWPLLHPLCMPLVPVKIVGSASLAAFRAQNSHYSIATKFLSKDTVKLMKPEKCHAQNMYIRPPCGINSSDSNVVILEKMSRRFFGERIHQSSLSSSAPRVKVKASTVVQFQLQLERDVSNDSQSGALEEWRTKPTIERLWFDVVARVEGEKLQPLSIKGVRPFISLDSAAWSDVLSNISLTRFPTAIFTSAAFDARY